MGSIETPPLGEQSHFDVLIIGAGVSGINAAYRVQTELPSYDYAVIEARGAMGGTWDLFRYPGIRLVSILLRAEKTVLANCAFQIRLGSPYIWLPMAPMECSRVNCYWARNSQVCGGLRRRVWN